MPKPPPTDPGLTFDWRIPRGERSRLFFWMLVTFFGLAAFFALFRVVYPQTQRLVPIAQQVTLLGSDTAAQSVLNSVQDHDFLIIPSADSKRNFVSLEDRAPVFHPSYEKHELKLLDLPQRNTKPAPVRLLDVREPILPRLDLTELKNNPQPAPPAHPAKLTLHLRGGLASRAIASQPDFNTLQMIEPESWRFHLGVNSAGQVIFVLPIDAPGKLGDAVPLLRLLQQIRFAPDVKAKATWGKAALVWSTAAQP
ncbi:MAG: hypothetical protein K8R87_06625 [Verrucomicrobia bacterium]|nr:hypothetical protein [Verrucomicrobiota bacterium]